MSATAWTILVVGATGKQGSAFIHSTLASKVNFHILALTRSAASPAAKALASLSDKVRVVEANLDKPETVKKVFKNAQQDAGGIWGVFAVLAFPGLGADAKGEEQQGMMLADLALEYKVQHFVFSSLERGGESHDDHYTLDRAAKIKIERYIRSLDGLPWTFLLPAFFMENFDGTIGTITTSVLRCGLQPGTKLQLIAAEDIGHVARAVFEAPEQYRSKSIPVVGDALTTQEQADTYKRGAGKPLPAVAAFVAKALLAMNSHTKALVADIERVHAARTAMPEDERYEALIARCRTLYPGMLTFEEWARKKGKNSDRGGNWNNVTVLDLVKGKR